MKIELHIFSTEMPREICTCQQSLVDIALMLEEVLLVQLPRSAHWINGTSAILMSSTISHGTKDSLASLRTGNLIGKSCGLKCIKHMCQFKVGVHLVHFTLIN